MLGIEAVVAVDGVGVRGEAAPVDPLKIRAGEPRPMLWNHYTDGSGQFHAGIWESQPGRWAVNYTEHEFMLILSGVVRLSDRGGRVLELQAGDAVVIPAGFAGTWETVAPVRKYYVVFLAQMSEGR